MIELLFSYGYEARGLLITRLNLSGVKSEEVEYQKMKLLSPQEG